MPSVHAHQVLAAAAVAVAVLVRLLQFACSQLQVSQKMQSSCAVYKSAPYCCTLALLNCTATYKQRRLAAVATLWFYAAVIMQCCRSYLVMRASPVGQRTSGATSGTCSHAARSRGPAALWMAAGNERHDANVTNTCLL